MQALRWHDEGDVRVDDVPKPEIKEPTDAIVEITATAICGSDLHLYNDFMPGMEEGDILGHEPMGEVVEVGEEVDDLREGDRVVIPFTISCGECWFCENDLYSLCDETNPNAEMAAETMGHSPAGLFGFSHTLGGYDGGQAEYLRVPHADVGPIKIESDLSDEEVLFLSDIYPTGYMAAENAEIEENDTVAVWGCGPVGQFAIQSAWMMGADRVIAIDRIEERLGMAEGHADTEVIDYSEDDVYEWLMDETDGRGPDRCIDAVGSEAHHTCVDHVPDEPDRPYVLQEAIKSCRKGGTLSIPGVYIDGVDDMPMGPLMNKALTVNAGQTHVQAYLNPLLETIENGEIDPAEIITHRGSLEDGPELYETFNDKEDDCIKVVLEP
ncbi:MULTISPECIES: zinc-dependent alcohol dehydrogenase [Halobacteriales]|uniref:Alcohol dehydrogenase GroES domain protein n=1 Tax=Halalkalicoccus jeotgali (strain DSM 18796 / CECT 7217 / JCM 14584 / KCTC 4019 / B3) TaxID=795797 RepID=D8JC65_HALJB|nr:MULTISPECIES: zinc-dependent alcohol dehydrogenase [Halobacteria]ADJ16972.1 Alcohol dehydrogenase GroES domain protein [Halalkalicoccus jeotgali B3]ADJ17003.1 Alcohol dehydrogenase GroES domain protein [Halalkalicoccus jeotgali B3]